MMNEHLFSRLDNHEDSFTERKTSLSDSEVIRRTLVAFANSVPEGRTAVLFIGISDDGTVVGVDNTDKTQMKVRKICEEECYPPIPVFIAVLNHRDKAILAVEVHASRNRPHFAGPAYVRRGSESIKATPELYEELIASRNQKCWEILKWKDQVVTVKLKLQLQGLSFSASRGLPMQTWATYECRVVECSHHIVRVQDIASARYMSLSIENILVSRDEEKHRLLLIGS